MPCDAHVWTLTDPETAVGTDPLATVLPALMPDLPRLIRLKSVFAKTGTHSRRALLSRALGTA